MCVCVCVFLRWRVHVGVQCSRETHVVKLACGSTTFFEQPRVTEIAKAIRDMSAAHPNL